MCKQYSDLMRRIIKDGEWVYNERTGKKCKVIINADLEYSEFPIVTTRKSYWKSAVAEMVGYLRGYSSAADFRALGTNTWDANANENPEWLKNPNRLGEDDMGRVYGVQARSWRKPEWYKINPYMYTTPDRAKNETFEDVEIRLKAAYKNNEIDQLMNVYNNLKAGKDSRGEIITFYNPGEFHMGCLRPCMHTHQFSLVNGVLYLNSFSRSMDVPLGGNFNMVQCWFLLTLMAQITGTKPGKVFHKIVNAHIYEDQYDMTILESEREHINCKPEFIISDEIKTLEDVETIFDVETHCSVKNYQSHPAIKYPFSV